MLFDVVCFDSEPYKQAILWEARQIQSLIDDFLMTKCPLRGSISFKNRDSCFGDTDQKDVPAVFLEGET